MSRVFPFAEYVLVSVLPFGLMTQPELAKLAPPSVAAILGSLVGQWGGIFDQWRLDDRGPVQLAGVDDPIGRVALGRRQGWQLSEGFARTNKHGAASVSLWVSTAIMQTIMILMSFSNDAWNVMLFITGVMILPAYIGSTGFL